MVLTDGERLISFIEIVKLLLERDADKQYYYNAMKRAWRETP